MPSWGIAFGLLTILLVMSAPVIERKLGAVSIYIMVWIVVGVDATAFEIFLVHILHVYTYYQKPEFLIFGVPWSNIPLSGNLVVFCFSPLYGTLGSDAR
jgi:hypothetical protein